MSQTNYHPAPEEIQEILNQYKQLSDRVMRLRRLGQIPSGVALHLTTSELELLNSLDPRIYDRFFDENSGQWTVYPGPMALSNHD